jgi:hypothetical protein
MEIFWRVKKVRLSYGGVFVRDWPFAKSQEESLVCPPSPYRISVDTPGNIIKIGFTNESPSPPFFPVPTNKIYASTDFSKFYPYLVFYFVQSSLSGDMLSNLFYPPTLFFEEEPGGTINFFGKNIQGFKFPIDQDFEDDPPTPIYGPNINASVEAAEYWSYGGTWDTATGEPL